MTAYNQYPLEEIRTHGVTGDGHPTRVDWVFFEDQFGEFLGDISIHLIMIFPPRLRSINIKSSTSAEIPRLILSINTSTTYQLTHGPYSRGLTRRCVR
jgi:hypothetical protein